MAGYYKQIPQAGKKKICVSYVIRDKYEKCHRSGVNALQYDSNLDRLYSAGRDSVIRIWDANKQDTNEPATTNPDALYQDKESSLNNESYVLSMEHHTDWVNDIKLCCKGRYLISVSNDTTLKIWNAHVGYCLSTLRSHKDYAKCLAYAQEREVVASAGFDRIIYLWDIQALTMLTATKNTVTTKPLDGSKSSIYSLAINQSGTLVASGSTEKVIRLWDPRSKQKLLKLRGHTDNVRGLQFSRDGSLLLSASSDGTIRLWSVGQQRCVSTIRVHDGGVWAIQTDESFSTVYSGGKDCKVFMTDLKDTSNTALLCQESAHVLDILLVNRSYSTEGHTSGQSLWVATTGSDIKNWNLPSKSSRFDINEDRNSNDSEPTDETEIPVNSRPEKVIKGNPAVIDYHILNDRRHILTLESDGGIAMYDVLKAKRVERIQCETNGSNARVNFEEEIKRRFKLLYVPNWFTVDLKIGLICIHLEENESLSAWVSVKDYGFALHEETQDHKVNLGCLMLQALFEHWSPCYDGIGHEESQNDKKEIHGLQHSRASQAIAMKQRNSSLDRAQSDGSEISKQINQYFSIVPYTPVIISEGNQTLLRFLAYDASNENESAYLHEIIPNWISEIVLSNFQPKFTKIPFFLLPHVDSGIKSLRKERLSASDMLQMRKVIEHVCEKMLVNTLDESHPSINPSSSTAQEHSSDTAKSTSNQAVNNGHYPVDKVEIYCNDQKLEHHLDLRTVRHYIWKSGGDLVLHYMPIK